MKGTITIHGETGHMAVNVKTHGMRFADVEGATEQQQEIAFEIAAESFWSQAEDEAKQCGFGGVEAEGRMSGWCVPHFGDVKVNRYPSLEIKTDCQRFLKFQKRIERLLSEVPDEYQYRLNDLVMSERTEQQESERIVR
jgi:hypothetical protein